MQDTTEVSGTSSGARGRSPDGPTGRPITAGFLQLATVVSALVLVIRNTTPAEILTVITISALFSIALWRADWLYGKARLDILLVSVCLLIFVILIGLNVTLSHQLDSAMDDRAEAGDLLGELEDDVARLEEENEELRDHREDTNESQEPGSDGAGSSSSSSTSSTTNTTSEAGPTAPAGHDTGPGVHANGNVSLPDAGDRYLDLDQWELWYYRPEEADIGLENTTLSGYGGSLLAQVPVATFAECGADHQWVTYIETTSVERGANICVTTNEGRRGVLTITAIYDDGYSLDLVGTIWETS